jgi:hypothetical protein
MQILLLVLCAIQRFGIQFLPLISIDGQSASLNLPKISTCVSSALISKRRPAQVVPHTAQALCALCRRAPSTLLKALLSSSSAIEKQRRCTSAGGSTAAALLGLLIPTVTRSCCRQPAVDHDALSPSAALSLHRLWGASNF